MTQPSKSLYLELLKKALIDYSNINTFEYHPLSIVNSNWKTFFLYPLDKLLRLRNFAVFKLKFVSQQERINGYDWPAQALSMIGLNRLSNIEHCIRNIIRNEVPGDLIETGVWRGGATIFMRAVLKELNIKSRKVWVADSFKGLPEPDAKNYKADAGNSLHTFKILTASLKEVKENFKKYDLLDNQVEFLEGWFKDTLHNAPISQLALLRLDGDRYESTIQALHALYPKLSIGGYIIVDDYYAFPFCKQAVDDYRRDHGIGDLMIDIDQEAIFWCKKTAV